MRRLGSFLYQFVFVDQTKQRLSHTKFWSHVGYAAMVYAFLAQHQQDATIYMLFGLIVVGNRTVMKLLEKKQ